MKELPAADARKPVGADLVIPALALAFALYFFFSIRDLAWEAKANGVLIGGALVILIAAQLVRIALGVARGKSSLALTTLLEPRALLGQRIALVLITAVFIATLPWLGVTLGLFLGLCAALYTVGIRRPKVLLAVSAIAAAAVYILFIAILDSAFPHGPVEHAVSAVVGLVR